MSNFDDTLRRAEGLLQSNRPEEALPYFEVALETATSEVVELQLRNTIARIKELTGARGEATSGFLQLLEMANAPEPDIQEQRALALNNLGRLALPQNPDGAIEYFDQSIEIYKIRAGVNGHFYTHLAHSYMARGEAYYLKKKYWFSKKDYKAALELHRENADVLGTDMVALAHYQLGAIYMDEFNAYDAQTNYRKALDLYLEGVTANPSKYRPLVAACLNNLAVSNIQLEEYEKALGHYKNVLEEYQWLSQEKPDVFLPYLAATYASLGIVYSDKMNKPSEALLMGQKAKSLYENLSEQSPGKYLHYLATAYHNSGIYALETEQWKHASSDLIRALELRKRLIDEEPEAFGADYCVTALNLLELFQRKLEVDKDLEYRERGLELLADLKVALKVLPETPSVVNMKNDFKFFQTYFNGVDAEGIQTLDTLEKIRLWDQEIDSTLDLSEKAGYQEKILKTLEDFHQTFPQNRALRKPFVLALNNMAWLELCTGGTEMARKLLVRARAEDMELPALRCNEAHCDLLDGKVRLAIEKYESLAGEKNESNADLHGVIQEDIKKLEACNLLEDHILEKLKSAGILRPHS